MDSYSARGKLIRKINKMVLTTLIITEVIMLLLAATEMYNTKQNPTHLKQTHQTEITNHSEINTTDTEETEAAAVIEVTESISQPASATLAVIKATTESPTEPSIEPSTEPTTTQTTESPTTQITEQSTEPSTEPLTTKNTEPLTESSAEPMTIQTTESSTTQNITSSDSNPKQYNGIYEGDIIISELTYYDVCIACCSKTTGVTASGIVIKNGVAPEIPIVSCNWLPFGTIVEIRLNGSNSGVKYVVADRGGSSLSKIGRFDIFEPRGHEQAKQNGRVKNIEVKICTLP